MISKEVVRELERLCGKRNVMFGDPEKMESYSHDEVAESGYSTMPDTVVKPGSAEEISEIMKLANRELVPVTPRGAGSGLSGGCVPVNGGIVLSLERMNRILDIDLDNLMITVEPGVVTNTINEVLKKDGLWYAGYPMSLETCFIGGNVAENAGGGKAVKYGVTSRYITGLEVVLPTGEILQLGGKLRKNVTGYDLIHLLAGSEGTLGIITRITLSLLPLPGSKAVLLALFEDAAAAIRTVPKLLTAGKIIPASIEFMDALSFRTSCAYLNEKIDYGDAEAMLIIEVDGNSDDDVERDYERLGTLCEESGSRTIYVADNKTTIERIWNIRRNIAEAFKVDSTHQSLEDIVVPTASIPVFMERLQELISEYDVPIPCYGHAGDGNLHATVVKPPSLSLDEWHVKLPLILKRLYTITASCGGLISGEHGIGSKRKDFVGVNLSPATIALMKRLKRAFDPNWILNPGKIFPDD